MHLTFTNTIPHSCKYFNSEVAASRSEVIPCGIVKLLLRSSEVKCSAYRAEGTLHARSALHLRSILHVPLAEHLVQKTHLCLGRQKCVFCLVGEDGFEPSKRYAADLQSVPFGHSGTPPYLILAAPFGAGRRTRSIKVRLGQALAGNARPRCI